MQIKVSDTHELERAAAYLRDFPLDDHQAQRYIRSAIARIELLIKQNEKGTA